MMKRILAILIVLALMMGLVSALGEEMEEEEAPIQRLRVGTMTSFTGNFFSDLLGNNVSDQDVRKLIHGYSLVNWNPEDGNYQFDDRVVGAAAVTEDGSEYTLVLTDNMRYSDGTAITAADYAFSLLLQYAPVFREATGASLSPGRIRGDKAYTLGQTNTITGVRIMSEYVLRITLSDDLSPYFYELKALDVIPLPVDVLAPGCQVIDTGDGAHIVGDLTADILRETLLDAETGYMSHPSVTTGPYQVTGYNGYRVSLALNPWYLPGEGIDPPQINQIEYVFTDAEKAMQRLAAGQMDLLTRCIRLDQIQAGLQLAASGDFSMAAYSRNGLGFISFCAEDGPVADVNVRKALAMCVDKDQLVSQYLGAYGVTVKGYYGIGQWMYQIANGTMIPADEEQAQEWEGLNLDGITEYTLNTGAAAELLDEAGWNLNSQGKTFSPRRDSLRYRKEGDNLIPLKVKMIYPENNRAGRLMNDLFAANAASIGMEVTIERIPMADLLDAYYGRGERDCDMIMLGTNFTDVFDPSADYAPDSDTNRITGITDAHLAELCRDLRMTEPGDTAEYCRKWIAMEEYRADICSEIPLYGNAYLDFHTIELRNYHPASTSSWSTVITDAYLGEEEIEEEEEEGEEGDEFFFD